MIETILQTLFIENGKCPLCQRVLFFTQDHVCAHCMDRLSVEAGATCTRCGRKKSQDRIQICLDCLTMPPVFHQGSCAFAYSPQVKALVYAMKFKHRPGLCRFGGKWMATQLEKRHGGTLFDGVQRILPVPLHPATLKQRGYNQSLALAQGLLENWSGWRSEAPLLLEDVLEKRGDGLHQRELGKLERQKNAETIFHVKNPEKIQGLHVLLVDDVRTTGATANACATLLLKAGASRVDVTVFAGVES